MLRNTHDLLDYAIEAADGTIGHVKDLYFDDHSWVVRYLVVDAGSWLSRRKVLVSPIAVTQPDWHEKKLRVSLTKKQVRNSPDIDTAKPVSRQQEETYLSHYNYPFYWGGSGLWGDGMVPGMMIPGIGGLLDSPTGQQRETDASPTQARATVRAQGYPHLRSCNEVTGYHIHASDGDIGHVQGLLVDEQSWAIRYMVVDTSNWWIGHKVLIVPQWIQDVSWSDSKVSVDVTRQAVQDAPPYQSEVQFDRVREADIYKHYKRVGYWDGM